MIMLRGLLSACIVLAITVLATLQAAYASPILSNLSPTISSLHEHPTWSTSSFSSFTQQLKSAYGHCRSKTQSDPSHPKVLVGYGFTQKFNWDEKTAKDPGYLSDFFLVRPSNPKSDSKGDLVLYQKPILPTRNPHADPKHYLKCMVQGDKVQINEVRPTKHLTVKPEEHLGLHTVATYRDLEDQGIDDTVLQISPELAMEWRLRATCFPSDCENSLNEVSPPNWKSLLGSGSKPQ